MFMDLKKITNSKDVCGFQKNSWVWKKILIFLNETIRKSLWKFLNLENIDGLEKFVDLKISQIWKCLQIWKTNLHFKNVCKIANCLQLKNFHANLPMKQNKKEKRGKTKKERKLVRCF